MLWAYHGWQNIAPMAGEVREPQRNLPLALIGGTLIVVALYLGVNLAYYLTMPAAEMAGLKGTTVAVQCASAGSGRSARSSSRRRSCCRCSGRSTAT